MRAILASIVLAAAAPIADAGLILNEYNAVGSTRWLGSNSAGGSTASDTTFGRVQGNGGNWIELVVTSDNLDIRNWELQWYEIDSNANGTAIWDPTRTVVGQDAQGYIRFSDNPLWSNLTRGTILTITEYPSVDTVDAQGNPVNLNLSTNTSFNPAANDWWINISSIQEAASATPLVTTLTNLFTYVPGSFSVGNDNWEMRIVNGSGVVQQPSIGEVNGGYGLSSTEVGKLEYPAAPATLADWQDVTVDDYNDGTSSSFGQPNLWSQGTLVQDFSPLRAAAVPEASSLAMSALAGMGGAALLFLRRRRRSA